MRPKKPETTGSNDLFRARLDQIINLKHELAQLAEKVDWDRYPDDPDFVVLADPEGNRFCIVNTSHGHE